MSLDPTDLSGDQLLIPEPWAVSWTDPTAPPFNGPQAAEGGVRVWRNSLHMTNLVPIGPGTSSVLALLPMNDQRALLILQNNSTATSPDSAPTFFFSFGQLAQVGHTLALPPGVGLVLDVRVPIDAVYVVFGPFSNGGGTAVIQGVASEGAYELGTGPGAS